MKYKKTKGGKHPGAKRPAMPAQEDSTTFSAPNSPPRTTAASQGSGWFTLLIFAFLFFVAASLSGTFSFGLVPEIIGCDYFTASLVFVGALSYGFLASILIIARPSPESPLATRMWARAVRFVGKWMWILMGIVIISGFVMIPIGRVFSSTTGHYVEVVTSWEPVFHRWRDYGSDSFTTPEPGDAPILQDLITQNRLQVLDNAEDKPLATRLKHEALIVDRTTGAPALRYAQARVRKSLFGKLTLIGVDYVPFDELPAPVQQKAQDQLASYHIEDVWRFAKRHPEHAGKAELAFQYERKRIFDLEQWHLRRNRDLLGKPRTAQ